MAVPHGRLMQFCDSYARAEQADNFAELLQRLRL